MRPFSAGRSFSAAVFLILFFILTSVGPTSAKSKSRETVAPENSYFWFNGDRKEEIILVPDEIILFLGPGKKRDRATVSSWVQALDPKGTILEENGYIVRIRIPEKISPAALRKKFNDFRKIRSDPHAGPSFRTGPESSNGRRSLTGEIIVHFHPDWDEARIRAWAEKRGLTTVRNFSFAKNAWLFATGESGFRSLEISNDIYLSGEVQYAYPNWFKTMELRSAEERVTTPNDPLFSNQWHLKNTGQGGCTSGQDVNIQSVWDTYQGSTNQVIAVTDTGLEIGHEDISPNVVSGLSHDYVSGDGNPTPESSSHGTSVGGVAAARGNNSKGVVGAAFKAGLVGYRLIEGGNTDANEADAMTRNENVVDINSNSWGPSDTGTILEGPGTLTESALVDGTTNGRGGKGILYLWAGGNGNQNGDNSNYDGYANSRYTIAVAASDCSGKQSYYSEPGANIVVTSPSNGGAKGIYTTTATGTGDVSSNYTSSFGGTSSATPLVSGILALVLQADPNLGWRDVIRLLVTTSKKIDPTDSDWTTNGAGHFINHKYGFGQIDAGALAGAAAAGPTLLGAETTVTQSKTVNQTVPDNDSGTGVTSTITVSQNLTVEYVDVTFNATHPYRGDLRIVLTSPEGTPSVLASPHGDSGSNYSNWRFGSIRPYDESSSGTWTLKVTDEGAQDVGTFNSWSIKIYGRTGGSGISPTSTPTPSRTPTPTRTSTPNRTPTSTPTPTREALQIARSGSVFIVNDSAKGKKLFGMVVDVTGTGISNVSISRENVPLNNLNAGGTLLDGTTAVVNIGSACPGTPTPTPTPTGTPPVTPTPTRTPTPAGTPTNTPTPSSSLTVRYPIPSGTDTSTLQIMVFNNALYRWVPLSNLTIDNTAHTITGTLSFYCPSVFVSGLPLRDPSVPGDILFSLATGDLYVPAAGGFALGVLLVFLSVLMARLEKLDLKWGLRRGK